MESVVSWDRRSEGLGLLEADPWLEPHTADIRARRSRYYHMMRYLTSRFGTIKDFASGHHHFGFHETPEGWYYRETAPAAHALFLMGDFNGWNRDSHPLHRTPGGDWEIFLPREIYAGRFTHGSFLKVRVIGQNGDRDRIPLYIRRVVQNPVTHDFVAQYWNPAEPYQWEHPEFRADPAEPLLIYEAHVGMAQDYEGIGTYKEFADNILPRIRDLGYNAVQLMGVMEHPYYGSFGYHVSNFFAASSRFGTPEDLKALIDRAHGMGIAVLLDIVHSHAVTNINEGINEFDGTVHQFFHGGPKGEHPAWGSKLFDYGKLSVVHFLLSNVRFWLEEYHFDGFRFDGVTSMLYHHRGLGTAFDHYKKYFSMDTDTDAVLYLQLANEVAREVNPSVITIAEDMSAMPGMCLPSEHGGVGFDYRLAMGVPDLWIKYLRDLRDDDWSLSTLWHELTTRRPREKSVGYAESHDQAMVGDKTLIFWLVDAAMYWHMNADDDNMTIARGIALHKMIRLLTLSLGSEAYLNFMGNEFGHPEWIDFPREGNGWSYKYARRQWHLVDNPKLKYKYLNAFDRGMIHLARRTRFTRACDLCELWRDQDQKILIFRKGGLIFVFNFHPTRSVADFEFYLHEEGNWRIALSTDDAEFGGPARVDTTLVHRTFPREGQMPPHGLRLYIPCRSAMVLERVGNLGQS